MQAFVYLDTEIIKPSETEINGILSVHATRNYSTIWCMPFKIFLSIDILL